jgi:glycosyltransferase involved in cell wall biosynthesis
MPTYNRAFIIREALESALAQTYEDFEIVVVDDASADDTEQIVRKVGSDKIRYIRHDVNRGCSAAYNTGIKEAKGQLIAFLDSDDLWKPSYLERQIKFLEKHPEVDVVFCDTETREPDGTLPSLMPLMRVFPNLIHRRPGIVEYIVPARQIYLCLLEEIPIKPTATLVRRAMFDRAGFFDEAWPSGTDWDLFLRFSRVANFGYIDEALTIQQRVGNATHQQFREKDKLFLILTFTREKANLSGDRSALRGVNRGISYLYNSLAWTYLQSGRRSQALSTYYQGFKETTEPFLVWKMISAFIRR